MIWSKKKSDKKARLLSMVYSQKVIGHIIAS